jgi:hypothetical protein
LAEIDLLISISINPAPAPATVSAPVPTVIKLSRGSGYGGHPYNVGQVVVVADFVTRGIPEYVTVLTAKKEHYREDGLCFGVGDDEGYLYSATARPATPEEIAPVKEAQAAKAAAAEKAQKIKDLAALIVKTGTCPPGPVSPEDEAGAVRLHSTQTIYGGDDWFVTTPTRIWYVRNNGADGDTWANNNVATGGAGAIGWYIEYNAAHAAILA